MKQGRAIYLPWFDVVIADLRNVFVAVQSRVEIGHEFRRAGRLPIARQIVGAARSAQLPDQMVTKSCEQEVRRKPALLALSGEREPRGRELLGVGPEGAVVVRDVLERAAVGLGLSGDMIRLDIQSDIRDDDLH